MNSEIYYDLPLRLINAINEQLAIDGLELGFVKQEGPGLYLIKIEESVPSPDLGVHIQDGIGSKDKVGG